MIDLEAIKRRAAVARERLSGFEIYDNEGTLFTAVHDSAADVPALVTELERARAFLRAHEWEDGDWCWYCIGCNDHSTVKEKCAHKPGCELKALIGEGA